MEMSRKNAVYVENRTQREVEGRTDSLIQHMHIDEKQSGVEISVSQKSTLNPGRGAGVICIGMTASEFDEFFNKLSKFRDGLLIDGDLVQGSLDIDGFQ